MFCGQVAAEPDLSWVKAVLLDTYGALHLWGDPNDKGMIIVSSPYQPGSVTSVVLHRTGKGE